MLYILIGIELFLSFITILILENDISYYNRNKRFFFGKILELLYIGENFEMIKVVME